MRNCVLTKNFMLAELCASETARRLKIRNEVFDAQVEQRLKALCENVLQPVRDWLGGPLVLSSAYRCPDLNLAVGGSKTSQHMRGEAADINIHGDQAWGQMVFAWIRENVDFDKLIWEHNKAGVYWIHVSYKSAKENRHQVIEELLKA